MGDWIGARQGRERVLADLVQRHGIDPADAKAAAVSVSGDRRTLLHDQVIDGITYVVAVDKRVGMTKDKEFQKMLTALGHIGRKQLMDSSDFHHAHLCPLCKAGKIQHWQRQLKGLQSPHAAIQ